MNPETLNPLEFLFTMTCGSCGQTSPHYTWCQTTVFGELPLGEFQCPKCGYAYRRQRFVGNPYRKIDGVFKYQPIDLIRIPTRL